MKKILLILLFLPTSLFAQVSIGIKSDYLKYNIKSYLERIYGNGYKENSAISYSAFAIIPYKPLISFGIEAGGYNFSIDKNKTTNLFIKPTIIFNAKLGRNILAIDLGISFDAGFNRQINNPYQNYSRVENKDTIAYQEKAFFYKLFASPVLGISYTRKINNFGIGVKFEVSQSEGGFYKGYDSSFKKIGIFAIYTIPKKDKF